MFGSATMVVLTTGNGVNGFTLDPVSSIELILADLAIERERHLMLVCANETTGITNRREAN